MKYAQTAFMFGLALSSTLAACALPTPQGATASANYSDQLTAQVTAVDKTRRLMTLRGPQGNVATIKVADGVQNFNQIQVGDKVRINYMERIDVTVAGKHQPLDVIVVQSSASRAPRGQMPAGSGAVTAKRSVQIVSVDKNSHTVTFREGDGTLDSYVVQNPANYAFADGLQPGTVVDVAETAAMAISVDRV
jgi:hypothetical protein